MGLDNERIDDLPPHRGETSEGFRFLHLLCMQLKQDLYDTRAKLGALLTHLAERGAVDLEMTTGQLEAARAVEYEHIRTQALVQIGEAVDKYSIQEPEGLDCASRIHLCKAVCCTFDFRLSAQDLDEGVLRWNYGEPYSIKKSASGYCVHSCSDAGGGCDAYAHRPAPCRSYDCRDDERVWSDFEAMIPAAQSRS